MLQAKLNSHNDKPADHEEKAEAKETVKKANNAAGAAAETTPDGVWSGDPGDGTDFITVVDIPIEDQAATPTYDIFDRPTTPVATPAPASAQLHLREVSRNRNTISPTSSRQWCTRSTFRRIWIPSQQRLQLSFFSRRYLCGYQFREAIWIEDG